MSNVEAFMWGMFVGAMLGLIAFVSTMGAILGEL